MTPFEFDDIIRRKLENARYENAEASFSKIKHTLNKRRRIYYLQKSVPFTALLLIGIGIGYWMGIQHPTPHTNIASINYSTPLLRNSNDQFSESPFPQSEKNSDIIQHGNSNLTKNILYKHQSPRYIQTMRNNNEKNYLKETSNDKSSQHFIDTTNNLSDNSIVESIRNVTFGLEQNNITAVDSSSKNTLTTSSEEKKVQNSIVSKNSDSSSAPIHPFVNYVSERKNNFYFHAFGGYSFGWKKNGTTEGNGLIPEIGIIYERSLPENLFLRTGLELTMVRSLDRCVNTFTVVELDTRYKQTLWEFKTPVVYYLRIPVKFGIKDATTKNYFNLGVFVNYLINSKNEIRKISYNNASQYSTETMIDYGYAINGFNRFTSEFTMGYRRKIKKNLRIGLDLNYYITNIIRSYDFFNQQPNQSSKAPSIYAGIEYRF